MKQIAFDSNVLTYFLEANSAGYDPSADPDQTLARERVSAYRLFLYADRAFVVPTVEREAKRIRDAFRRDEHLRFIWYHFMEILESSLDAAFVTKRMTELCAYHADGDDCRALAEAEAGRVDVLVTFDKTLKKRLQPRTNARLKSPAECWVDLDVPRGTPPRFTPADGHPLQHATWWRWE